MGVSIAAICIGASLGALLRWGLATWLNALLPELPPGTWVANAVGGYLIGIAFAFFAGHPALPAPWRLMVITGFLGGLTTFSAFSLEVVSNLIGGRFAWAAATVVAHLAASVAATLAGIETVVLLRGVRP